MKININGVSITLTKEQLIEIDKQTKNIKTIDDINSYKDAVDILSEKVNPNRTNQEELETIIRAVNFIDNDNKIWEADFSNKELYKYIPYFEMLGSGWSFHAVSFFYYCSFFSVGLYYKNKESAEIMAKRFNKLYNLVLG